MRQIYCDFVGRIWSSGPVSKIELLSHTSPDKDGDAQRVVAVLVMPNAALEELATRLSHRVEAAPSGPVASPDADEVVHVTLQTIDSQRR